MNNTTCTEKTYPEADMWLRITFLVFILAIHFVGVPGNIITSIIYVRKSPKTACDWLILTMSIADALVCFCSLPFHIRAELRIHAFWSANILCNLEQWLQLTAMIASCILLVVIAMDRYVKICHPGSVSLTPLFARNLGVFSIVISAAICIFPFVNSDDISRCLITGVKPSQGTRIYALFLLVWFIFSFFVVTFAYVNICKQISYKNTLRQRLKDDNGLRSVANTTHRTVTNGTQRTATNGTQKTATKGTQKAATDATQKSAINTTQNTATDAAQNAATDVTQKAATNGKQKTATNDTQKTATHTTQKTAINDTQKTSPNSRKKITTSKYNCYNRCWRQIFCKFCSRNPRKISNAPESKDESGYKTHHYIKVFDNYTEENEEEPCTSKKDSNHITHHSLIFDTTTRLSHSKVIPDTGSVYSRQSGTISESDNESELDNTIDINRIELCGGIDHDKFNIYTDLVGEHWDTEQQGHPLVNSSVAPTEGHIHESLKPIDNYSVRLEDDYLRQEDDFVRQEDDSVRLEDDSMRQKDDSVRQEDDSVRQEDDSVRHEGDSVRQEDGSVRLANDSVRLENDSVRLEDDYLRQEDDSMRQKDDSVRLEDGSVRQEDDSVRHEGDSVRQEDGSVRLADDSVRLEDDSVRLDDDSVRLEDGSVRLDDDSVRLEDDSVRLEDDSVRLDDDSVRLEDDSVRLEDGSVRLGDDSVRLEDDFIKQEDDSVRLEDDSVRQEDDSVRQEGDSVRQEGDSVRLEDDSVRQEDGSVRLDDDSVRLEDDSVILEDDSVRLDDDSVRLEDGSVRLDDDSVRLEDDSVRLEDDSVRLEDDSMRQEDDFVRQEDDSVRQEDDSVRQEGDSVRHEGDSVRQEDGSVRLDDDSVRLEDDSVILEDDSVRLDDDSVRLEDGSVRLDDDSVRLEDDYVRLEDDSVRLDDDSVRLEDGSVRLEDDSVRLEDGSVRLDDDSVRLEDDSVRLKDGYVRLEDDSVRLEDDSVRQEDDSVRLEDDSVRHEDDSVRLEDDSTRQEKVNAITNSNTFTNNLKSKSAVRVQTESLINMTESYFQNNAINRIVSRNNTMECLERFTTNNGGFACINSNNMNKLQVNKFTKSRKEVLDSEIVFVTHFLDNVRNKSIFEEECTSLHFQEESGFKKSNSVCASSKGNNSFSQLARNIMPMLSEKTLFHTKVSQIIKSFSCPEVFLSGCHTSTIIVNCPRNLKTSPRFVISDRMLNTNSHFLATCELTPDHFVYDNYDTLNFPVWHIIPSTIVKSAQCLIQFKATDKDLYTLNTISERKYENRKIKCHKFGGNLQNSNVSALRSDDQVDIDTPVVINHASPEVIKRATCDCTVRSDDQVDLDTSVVIKRASCVCTVRSDDQVDLDTSVVIKRATCDCTVRSDDQVDLDTSIVIKRAYPVVIKRPTSDCTLRSDDQAHIYPPVVIKRTKSESCLWKISQSPRTTTLRKKRQEVAYNHSSSPLVLDCLQNQHCALCQFCDGLSANSNEISSDTQISLDTGTQRNYLKITENNVTDRSHVEIKECSNSRKDFLALPGFFPRNDRKKKRWMTPADSVQFQNGAGPVHIQIEMEVDSFVEKEDTIYEDASTELSSLSRSCEQNGERSIGGSQTSDSVFRKSFRRKKMATRERQMTLMLVSVTAVFLMSWIPGWAMYMLWFYGTLGGSTGLTFQYLSKISLINYAASPLIYYKFNSSFRSHVKELLAPLFKCFFCENKS